MSYDTFFLCVMYYLSNVTCHTSQVKSSPVTLYVLFLPSDSLVKIITRVTPQADMEKDMYMGTMCV